MCHSEERSDEESKRPKNLFDIVILNEVKNLDKFYEE